MKHWIIILLKNFDSTQKSQKNVKKKNDVDRYGRHRSEKNKIRSQ